MIKKAIFWLSLLAITSLAAVWRLPDRRLHLVFCDVGQGDATLVSYRMTQILIDGGPGNKVLDCLAKHLPFWDRQIEMVILTHPQADHFGGLITVIERYNIKQFIINSLYVDAAGFKEFFNAVVAENVPVYSPQASDRIKIGPVELAVLWPQEKLGDEKIWLAKNSAERSSILGTAVFKGETNETSIVARLSFGNFDVLLTGDIGFDVEERLIEANTSKVRSADTLEVFKQIEVLKVAHHGSKYSTGEEFLAAIRPALAVISVGKNSYGHPTAEVMERISNLGTKLLRTDKNGEVEIVSDGKNWYTQQK